MNNRLALLLTILLLVGFAATKCAYNIDGISKLGPNNKVDFSHLKKSVAFSASTVDGSGSATYNYEVSLCSPFPKDYCGDKSTSTPPVVAPTVLQKTTAGDNCVFVGQLTKPLQVVPIDPKNIKKGVQVTYGSGESATNGMRKAVINIYCPTKVLFWYPNEKPTPEPTVTEEKGDLGGGYGYQYTFDWHNRAGCTVPCSFWFTFGCFDLGQIIFFITPLAFILYCVIGVLLQIFVRKQKGLHAIPNYTFWKNVPFDVFLGIKTIFGLFRKIGQKKKSYQEIDE